MKKREPYRRASTSQDGGGGCVTTDPGLQTSTLNRTSGPYIHLPTREALVEQWKRGREQYGPVFVGHPLEELDEELLDAMNYVEEAQRQGWGMLGAHRLLWELRERVCALYRRMPTRPTPEGECSARPWRRGT